MHIIVPCYSTYPTECSSVRQKGPGVQAFSRDRQSDPSLRVLLVEDDDAVRDELTEGLSLRGVDVVSATRAAEAMALLRRDECITVLVTDVRMPDGDGITLAEQVLRECDGARDGWPVPAGYGERAVVAARWPVKQQIGRRGTGYASCGSSREERAKKTIFMGENLSKGVYQTLLRAPARQNIWNFEST